MKSEHINCHRTLHTETVNNGIMLSLKKPYTMFTIKFGELLGSGMYTIEQHTEVLLFMLAQG